MLDFGSVVCHVMTAEQVGTTAKSSEPCSLAESRSLTYGLRAVCRESTMTWKASTEQQRRSGCHLLGRSRALPAGQGSSRVTCLVLMCSTFGFVLSSVL